MPWKGLRLSPSDANSESKRHSVIFIGSRVRHSEHAPRPTPSTSELTRRRSDSGAHSRHSAKSNGMRPSARHKANTRDGTEEPAKRSKPDISRPTDQRQPILSHRFSMLRFRHASDPQLSTSYVQADKNVPPVPPIPPPTIITTAPTTYNMEVPRHLRNGTQLSPTPVRSLHQDIHLDIGDRNNLGSDNLDLLTKGLGGHQETAPDLGPSLPGCPEPGRLSISSLRSSRRGHADDSTLPSEPDTRFSESSRSDRSSTEHRLYLRSIERDTVRLNKGFRLPHLRRNRTSLFPLAAKISPSGSASVSERRLPFSTLNGADRSKKSFDQEHPNRNHLSPLPSPSHSSIQLSSSQVASSAPPLLRKDSTASARSMTSFASTQCKNRYGGRGRSSTMDSLTGDQQLSPSLTPFSRSSTSTNGRRSFQDILKRSNKLRHKSELPGHGNGVSSSKPPGTPVYGYKPGLSLSRDVVSYPERDERETPATYLSRLEEAVSRGVIATILSKSDEDFYKTALRKYMRSFSFFGDPIDMAIRKLLMEVELPKETQQIDRVLQRFADRYHECNPGLFSSPDQAYFIAFSILILHTDVFNKNNKRKMQKQDYVRNTRGEGISEDILECFYENISYTPFIHVEDELNLSARHLAKPRRPLFKTTSPDHLSRAAKDPVDPYALILEGKLDALRPTLKDVMNLEDTYSCTGTGGPPDIDNLHQSFLKSAVLQIVSARSRPDAFVMPSSTNDPVQSHPGLVDIKVAKVGLLWRKDPKKKRTRSPWQEWGALLTFSQLYFFKDVNWVKSLMSQHESHQRRGRRHPAIFAPPINEFKPDVIMSIHDAVVLLDSSYKKHKHAFLFVRHNGLEEVFLANSEADMNDWLSKLNYAATFRTSGVRMKGVVGGRYEGRRRQASRLNSLSSDSSSRLSDTTKTAPSEVDAHLAEEVSVARKHLMTQRIAEADQMMSNYEKQLDGLLRNARHLQVLTPVNSRAREHVILAAGRMAAQLKWVRLSIWRTECYREVLSLDLGQEEKQSLNDDEPSLLAPNSLSSPSAPGKPSLAKLDLGLSSPSSKDDAAWVLTSPIGLASAEDLSSPISLTDQRRASTSASVLSSEVIFKGRQPSVSDINDLSLPFSHDTTIKRPEHEPITLNSRIEAELPGLAKPTKLATPADADDPEERVLREAGLLGMDGAVNASDKLHKFHDVYHEKPTDESQGTTTGEVRSRTRRSLQRSFRDSHHGSYHQRSRKGRDSGSSIPSVDDIQGAGDREGLSRKEASFTFHGKKASVITFGSEWQSMSSEERMKLRKPTPVEESKASEISAVSNASESTRSGSVNGGRPRSMRSASTTTVKSVFNHDSLPMTNEIPELPLAKHGRDRNASADDLTIDKSLNLSGDLPPALPVLSSSKVNGELPRIHSTKTESDTLSGEENDSIHRTVTQESMNYKIYQQAVSAS